METEAPSVSQQKTQQQLMPGTHPVLPAAAPLVKIRLECVKTEFILLIFATLQATKYARHTGIVKRLTKFLTNDSRC